MLEQLQWLEPDGTLHTLSNQADIGVRLGVVGRGMPPIQVTDHGVPNQQGRHLASIRFDAREIDLPIWIMGTDEVTVRSKLRDVLRWFDPTRGDGTLRVINADGTQRQIVCRMVSGGTLTEDEQRAVYRHEELLVLRAWDPYWQSVSESSEIFLLDNTTATFFPIFPLRLTSEAIFADATITNNGDTETWPVWDIWGPGENPTITNLNTGKRMALTHILGAGETVTIDTQPLAKTVTGNDGENLFPNLSTDSSLFPFPKGSTAVRVEFSGATSNSQVNVRWRERYVAP